MLVRVLALELWQHNISVNELVPCPVVIDPTPPEPISYVPAFDPPSMPEMCGFASIREGDDAYDIVWGPDGSSHVAAVEVVAGTNNTNPYAAPVWCVEGRARSHSTPGAHRSTWTAKIYKTNPRTIDSDFTDLASMTTEAFFAVFTPDKPDFRYPTHAAPHNCDMPCVGGWVQTQPVRVRARYIKLPFVYVRSEHTFTVDSWSVTVPLQVIWESTPRTQHSSWEYLGGVRSELADDLSRPVLIRVIDFLSSRVSLFRDSEDE